MHIILDAMCSKDDFVSIGYDKIPTVVLTDRLLTLKLTHIEYVIECMDKNTSNIENIKNYLLKALYNAPTTMDFYYANEVNKNFRMEND